MATVHCDALFAPIDPDQQLERIGGGNETEVYCTDDRNFVVKVKGEGSRDLEQALEEAKELRAAAERHARTLGPDHSYHGHYVVCRGSDGRIHVVVLQPFLKCASALFDVDWASLDRPSRTRLGSALRRIIRRSLASYRESRTMPDLYGRRARSVEERHRRKKLRYLPWRIGSVLKRNLLRSHNLMLTAAPERRLVLVDYDPIRRGWIFRAVYFNVRRALFLRDYLIIACMEQFGWVPRA